MDKAPQSQLFFQRVDIDFLGPYPRSRSGNTALFIVLYHLSKFVFVKAVKKLKSAIVVKYLNKELFHLCGVPETVVSDNGSQFKSELFQKHLREHRITYKLTAIQAPHANASERVNRSIITTICSYVDVSQGCKPKQYLLHVKVSHPLCHRDIAILHGIWTTYCHVKRDLLLVEITAGVAR